ncbi:hypothetical protein G6M89_17350 [Natronolimnobius sp. AArcel1]|uniref:hypothetical protein n=1 Tax=Natronolimnobius sp. AArcel1 TaxID=1679093 RepID=UPI0013EE17E8|nr:hypothetical protein [Natronolimnobius sp. AArcel1]NGM70751.1 hypothetical protein [Natronolimnobius sp. AArcel1]
MNTSTPVSMPARDIPSAIAILACVIILTLVVGPLGAVIALVGATVWYTLGTPYAIATGFVLLAVLSPPTTAVTWGGIVLAFLALALLPALRQSWGYLESGGLVTGTAVYSVLTWWLVQTQPLWLATGTVGICIVLTAYTMHRYELVELGLVPETQSTKSKTER